MNTKGKDTLIAAAKIIVGDNNGLVLTVTVEENGEAEVSMACDLKPAHAIVYLEEAIKGLRQQI